MTQAEIEDSFSALEPDEVPVPEPVVPEDHPTWDRFREALRNRLPTQAFASFVTQMSCVEDDGRILVLTLPDIFSLDWINNHYRDVLEAELQNISPARLELRVDERARAQMPERRSSLPTPASSSLPKPMTGLPGPAVARPQRPRPAAHPGAQPARAPQRSTQHPGANAPQAEPGMAIAHSNALNDRYTFSTFITGPSNQLASAAAQSVSDKPGSSYNPLFIFGRVGLGKTHLLQAVGHAILKRNPAARVQYLTTEQFINDVIQGIRFERMDEIRKTYRMCDVLLIDDIQFIAGKEACQTEFFHTFNALYDAKKQVVVTSDKLPHEIKDLEERVKTRFQWGLIVDLQPPELETRVAIVRKKAETDGIPLPAEVAMFIAQNVRSNVRELEGCLIRISAYASLQGLEISTALARDVLKDVISGKGHALTCEAIVKAVATHLDVKVSDLKSPKRGRAIALPRQIAMYLCRKHTQASYPEIGLALGGKDHTTALNAFNRIKERLADPEVRRQVEEIERLLLD